MMDGAVGRPFRPEEWKTAAIRDIVAELREAGLSLRPMTVEEFADVVLDRRMSTRWVRERCAEFVRTRGKFGIAVICAARPYLIPLHERDRFFAANEVSEREDARIYALRMAYPRVFRRIGISQSGTPKAATPEQLLERVRRFDFVAPLTVKEFADVVFDGRLSARWVRDQCAEFVKTRGRSGIAVHSPRPPYLILLSEMFRFLANKGGIASPSVPHWLKQASSRA